jgi:hypothetical protein
MVDLSHARHDRAHVLAPGLFRSLAPGDRKKLKLDVTYDFGAGEQIEFKGFEPLGVLEMRVLQGLVAMAGPDGLVLEDQDKANSETGQLMLDLFEPDPVVQAAKLKPQSLVIRDSLRRLAREIGMDEGGKSVKSIRQAIERMFAVSIFVQTGKRRLGMRMLAAYASDEGTGDLYVALNPRIASAIIGTAPYARIDLDEVRQLDSDPARFVHQRLCGWIDPGKSGEVSIDTLASYVWPDDASPDSATRMRKMRVRKAVAEISGLGWKVEEVKKDVWRFIRPKIPSLRETGHIAAGHW